MAKKKKKSAKKKHVKKQAAVAEVSKQSTFWPLAAAIIMMVVALFLLLGGFGSGGPLPKDLFHGVYWGLGWAAWLSPVALVFFGILKFREETRKVSWNVGFFGFQLRLVFCYFCN
jgi:hydrogenase/urease accessory protein HupE